MASPSQSVFSIPTFTFNLNVLLLLLIVSIIFTFHFHCSPSIYFHFRFSFVNIRTAYYGEQWKWGDGLASPSRSVFSILTLFHICHFNLNQISPSPHFPECFNNLNEKNTFLAAQAAQEVIMYFLLWILKGRKGGFYFGYHQEPFS